VVIVWKPEIAWPLIILMCVSTISAEVVKRRRAAGNFASLSSQELSARAELKAKAELEFRELKAKAAERDALKAANEKLGQRPPE
jgi:hypothetical protein